MTTEFCHNCRFWSANKDNAQKAPERSPCLLLPPQPGGLLMIQGLTGPQPQIIWGRPEPSQNEWCGGWQAADRSALTVIQ